MAPKKKPAAVQQNMSDIERIRVGMVAEEWNAAIRLLVVIRNGIDRPVTLLDALNIAREVVILAGELVDLDRFRKAFDDERTRALEARNAERDAIAKRAGRN